MVGRWNLPSASIGRRLARATSATYTTPVTSAADDGRRFRVVYRNPKKIAYEHYSVSRVSLNGKDLKEIELNRKGALIARDVLVKLARKTDNTIVVTLE